MDISAPPDAEPDDAAPLPLTRRDFRFGAYEGLYEPDEEAPRAAHLVIALTGVGNTAEPLRHFEFHRSLMARPGIDRVFLRDTLRSWYRCPEGRMALITHLRRLIRHRGYGTVTLLGLSMGAYGALALAEVLREARVVALSPAFSLDTPRHGRFIIRHKRWLDLNAFHAGTDLRLVGERGRYLLLFGDEEMIDSANLELFLEAGWQGLFVCPGASHNLGGFLQARGRLGAFMERLAEGGPLARLAAAAGAYPAYSHCHALRLLDAQRSLYAGEMAAADEALRDAAQAVGEGVPAVSRGLLLRLGLEGAETAAALERAKNLAWPSLALPLPGGELRLDSAIARQTPGGPMLGPLVRARLSLPGRTGPVRLAFTPEAPSPVNAGGDLTLTAHAETQGGLVEIARSAAPQAALCLPLVLDAAGQAGFALRRPCFGSAFHAHRTENQYAWSMRLAGLALSPD